MNFVCLDTSFLIDFLRGETNTRTSYLRLKSEGYSFATTTINAFEIFRGLDKRGRIKGEEEAVRKLLSRLVVWNLGIEEAERCSRIYTEMERIGSVIGLNDCFTAAIAISNGCQKIVSDDMHFQKIPGIERIPY
ncbi:MAG: type II toxin-antitoxin system VapC family toxin [Candidatus Thorarchaeota archaeon]|nr:type II toxin-antitoxin system VapC family toxin [Candidatus Thorarchaeota archaeon]